jgi:hypothetical protein
MGEIMKEGDRVIVTASYGMLLEWTTHAKAEKLCEPDVTVVLGIVGTSTARVRFYVDGWKTSTVLPLEWLAPLKRMCPWQ